MAVERPGAWTRVRAELWSPLLVPLVMGVVAATVAHVMGERGSLGSLGESGALDLGADRGAGEIVGYLFMAIIIVGLGQRARAAGGDPLLRVLAGTFLLVLADDLFRIHEGVGVVVPELLGVESIGSVPLKDLAELGYFAVVGATALSLWRRSWRVAEESSRHVARWVGALAVLLGGFAIGVDVLHELSVTRAPQLESMLAAVEDGGELLVLALIASFVFGHIEPPDEPIIDLREWIREQPVSTLQLDLPVS